MAFRSFLDKIGQAASGRAATREAGPPTSSNGASSMHLFWTMRGYPFVELRATIEVIQPPTVPKLNFWALQGSFEEDGVIKGGAHFGLQYHPEYPGAGAVNWGGYKSEGGELDGSGSNLPSHLANVNTRNYRWAPGRAYRYRIYKVGYLPEVEHKWRGSITDLETGEETVVRDLNVRANFLVNPMVWTESFGDCGDPSVSVRWYDLEAIDVDGVVEQASVVTVNYQSWADGGCTNTNCSMDGSAFVQRTNCTRTTEIGSQLTLMLP